MRRRLDPRDRRSSGFTRGQCVAYDAEHNTPLGNLFLAMLQRMALQIDAFGTSTLGETLRDPAG